FIGTVRLRLPFPESRTPSERSVCILPQVHNLSTQTNHVGQKSQTKSMLGGRKPQILPLRPIVSRNPHRLRQCLRQSLRGTLLERWSLSTRESSPARWIVLETIDEKQEPRGLTMPHLCARDFISCFMGRHDFWGPNVEDEVTFCW